MVNLLLVLKKNFLFLLRWMQVYLISKLYVQWGSLVNSAVELSKPWKHAREKSGYIVCKEMMCILSENKETTISVFSIFLILSWEIRIVKELYLYRSLSSRNGNRNPLRHFHRLKRRASLYLWLSFDVVALCGTYVPILWPKMGILCFDTNIQVQS